MLNLNPISGLTSFPPRDLELSSSPLNHLQVQAICLKHLYTNFVKEESTIQHSKLKDQRFHFKKT